MPEKTNYGRLFPYFAAGLLLALFLLVIVLSTSQGLFKSLGLEPESPIPAYNGFDAFIPFIPGYFPDNFSITYAVTGSNTSPEINTYSETYASDAHFFKTMQSQGEAVPGIQPNPGVLIQGQPANLTNSFKLEPLIDDDLDLNQFDTKEVWLVTFVMKEINIQVVTNLPKQEAILVAEGLIPSICTSTPTPEEQ